MELVSQWQERINQQPSFTALLGLQLRTVTPEEVIADLEVRPDLSRVGGIAHGGVVMAFADTLGAIAASVNVPEGATSITLESKTNLLAPAVTGTTITGRAEPLHRGRRTSVWQTRITNADGRLLAQTTQTQLVVDPHAKNP